MTPPDAGQAKPSSRSDSDVNTRLIEDLRAAAIRHSEMGVNRPAELHSRAADEIERVRGVEDSNRELTRQVEQLRAKVDAHRQAIWDALGHLGYDRDGDSTPAAFVYPPLTEVIVDVAKEFRAEYDELLHDDAALTAPPSSSDPGRADTGREET